MDVREKTASKKRLIDYYYLAEKIECPGVRLVYWDDIEAAPTVDAVEVIRCRECYHKTHDGGDRPYCLKLKMYLNKELDFFCKYGKRKEGAD